MFNMTTAVFGGMFVVVVVAAAVLIDRFIVHLTKWDNMFGGTSEINEILTKLESHSTELNNYSHDYQRLIQLNKHIEELFKKKSREISSMNEIKQDDTK